MSLSRYAQIRWLAIFLGTWLIIFFLTRLVLLASHFGDVNTTLFGVLGIFGLGLVHDLSFLSYAALPVALYLALCPATIWRRRWHQGLLRSLIGFSLFVMLFTAVSEWMFWDEFGVRFNFIAVDYLVYSNEVINNILESYPVYPLLAMLVVISAVGIVVSGKVIDQALGAPLLSRRGRGLLFAAVAGTCLLVTVAVGQDFPAGGGNTVQRELAGNGPFQFFAAFRNNELDYYQLYATLPDETLGGLLRQEVAEPNARFMSANPLDIRRVIDNPGEFRRLNVILVTVESLSAKYLGCFGDSRNLTPNLDRLRSESVFFNNFYATGTRTDRGLEAITLSIPPTPGRSIVKRLGRETGYASLGRQLEARGYDSVFLYGGRGYFDNMNAFFGGNGYRIIDQSSVPEKEITFKNAWGMCDENLYSQALRQADIDHAVGKPFFFQLMTTSNHRPYSYPEGRIDIPSGYGREGALKYTDYAIGEFLNQARQKPWFEKTVFVFVADHTAGSAGKEDLPVAKYRIPLFIYSPNILKAQEVSMLSSQIDLAPTLLGLLNLDYTSTFFGRNVLREDGASGRALIGNYQHLGLFDGQSLAILSPRRGMRRHDDALGLSDESSVSAADPLMRRDIAYYQGASHAFKAGLLRWQSNGLKEIGKENSNPSRSVSLSPRTHPES
ncbi:LTA synthase family protein [Desulfomicrobium sp. ZS1]|uniref:LTA synthase family protein n=1 Tax=Desulfomicrobium sp. ZS1 TaxID=2952228 RepID=UPI0020B43D50|nr:LTA synthase family protein [Desulfomicrobium sp. ZS1]UTF48857.1 LTA synthase family protein [Desulfomicrobium sp. ZS1]